MELIVIFDIAPASSQPSPPAKTFSHREINQERKTSITHFLSKLIFDQLSHYGCYSVKMLKMVSTPSTVIT